MLQNLTVQFCTYFKRIDTFQFDTETYDTYTAFCLKSGRFVYRVGDGEEQTLSGGELVICPPNVPFARRVVESIELLMIRFEAPDTGFCVGETVCLSDVRRLEWDLAQLETCLFCHDVENYPRFAHFAKDVLYMAGDAWEKSAPLAKMVDYMRLHVAELVSISTLAERCGYSTAHFINLFKKYYGKTPGQYLADLRLQTACELLAVTDKPSKEIAQLCGFADELYFIRFFKQRTGTTPTRFRVEKGVRI